MTRIICELPEGSKEWHPHPFPGSEVAFNLGCTCPQCQPWPGRLIFSDCPIHELEQDKS